MKTRTLQDRIDERWYKSGAGDKLFLVEHIRAEYEGLARRVRKLRRDDMKDPKRTQSTERTYGEALNDVLAIVRERKK